MCGIAGYYGPQTDAQISRVESMARSIRHRGPDDSGIWSDEGVVLAHRRLSIIDRSLAGHQPMISDCGRYVMTYNGEIYNYLELRNELRALGVEFVGHSDSEVLLSAFKTWGERCTARLNGMWAFAIWDRSSKRLFLSRDRFGEKPLYYVHRSGQFWFSSEIKALLFEGAGERAVNRRVVADFAADRVSDHTSETFFRNVLQLPPASNGWLSDGRLSVHRYWTLPTDSSEGESSPKLVEEVAELVHDAVRIRLRSDVDVGVLLSGGLDSSSVACLAATQSKCITAFSTIDREPPEEAAGIDAVLAAYPELRLHRDTPADDCLDTELSACLWHQEEPFADGSMLAHFRLMRLASDRGVKVLLTGQAADEVFAGYPGFQAQYLGELLRRGSLKQATNFYRHLRDTSQDLAWRSIVGHALPQALARAVRQAHGARSLDWVATEWSEVSPEVLAGYSQKHSDSVNGALRACLSARTVPGFLHYEDRNSMAFGVETRIPFLDHRLVEKVLPLPAAVKLSGGRTKGLLRDAVAARVPRSITNRLFKQGYPAPLARWMRASSKEKTAERLEKIRQCPIIAHRAWNQRYVRFQAGEDGQLPAVWRGMIIASWYSLFISECR